MSETNATLHADIAGLRADLQNTNKNLERYADLMEKTLNDHEMRIRKNTEDILVLQTTAGTATGLAKWLGPAGFLGLLASAIFWFTKHQ